MDDRLYVVAYDIGDPKRWRSVFKLMQAYGEWLQLSVFQCRLSARQHAEMIEILNGLIDHRDDHIIVMDLGIVSKVVPRVVSLGKAFEPVAREAVVV